MKKLVVLISILFVWVINVEAKKIEGQIITHRDTMEVVLKIKIKFFTQEPSFISLQNRVKFFDENGKVQFITADDADEINFNYAGYHYRMLSRDNPGGTINLFSSNKKVFLMLVSDGYLKHFHHYYTTTTTTGGGANGVPTTSTQTVLESLLQKGNEELVRLPMMGFKNKMPDYFKDCPVLADKIASKEFRRRDLPQIVDFYNSNCGRLPEVEF